MPFLIAPLSTNVSIGRAPLSPVAKIAGSGMPDFDYLSVNMATKNEAFGRAFEPSFLAHFLRTRWSGY
jgi:hypothetical protein